MCAVGLGAFPQPGAVPQGTTGSVPWLPLLGPALRPLACFLTTKNLIRGDGEADDPDLWPGETFGQEADPRGR